MRRFWLGFIAGAALLMAYRQGGAGTSVSEINGVGTLEASSSILALLGAIAIAMAFVAALQPVDLDAPTVPASAGRRAAAWLLDVVLSLTALASVLALLPLLVEAQRTGHFAWAFQRSKITATDWVLTLTVVALGLGGMAAYWTLPVRRRGQTIGQAILGLRAVAAGPPVPSVGRLFVRGFLQVFAPLLWVGKLLTGKYWHDEIAKVHVVHVLP